METQEFPEPGITEQAALSTPTFLQNRSVKGGESLHPSSLPFVRQTQGDSLASKWRHACSWPEHKGAGGKQEGLGEIKNKKKDSLCKAKFLGGGGVGGGVVCSWFWRPIPRPPPQE